MYKSVKVLYNLNTYHNSHIDILPTLDNDPNEINGNEEETIQNEVEESEAEIKLELSENEENCLTTINETDIAENINADKLKRNINCKELRFEIKYLSVEEQIEEIEMRKRSEKYKARKYKCQHCGVGFLTEDVFGEHMKRHEKVVFVYMWCITIYFLHCMVNKKNIIFIVFRK